MNRVLVLYDSATGNTAKMAQFVAEGAAGIDGIEVRIRSLDEATAEDVVWCDGLAVGSPTNMGVMSWKMKRFWDETMGPQWMKVDGKIACAFSSSGGWGGGAEMACLSLLTVLTEFRVPGLRRHGLRRQADHPALRSGHRPPAARPGRPRGLPQAGKTPGRMGGRLRRRPGGPTSAGQIRRPAAAGIRVGQRSSSADQRFFRTRDGLRDTARTWN